MRQPRGGDQHEQQHVSGDQRHVRTAQHRTHREAQQAEGDAARRADEVDGSGLAHRHRAEEEARRKGRQREGEEHQQHQDGGPELAQQQIERAEQGGEEQVIGVALSLGSDRGRGKGRRVEHHQQQLRGAADQQDGARGAGGGRVNALLRPHPPDQRAEHQQVKRCQRQRERRAQRGAEFAQQDGVTQHRRPFVCRPWPGS